jgi:DUF438 domain-containing protein
MAETLGSTYAETLEGLNELLLKLNEGQEKKAVRSQHRELLKKMKKLIDEQMPKTMQEYKDATAALKKANEAIAEAKKKTEKVAAVIENVATAISAIGKLLAALGMG